MPTAVSLIIFNNLTFSGKYFKPIWNLPKVFKPLFLSMKRQPSPSNKPTQYFSIYSLFTIGKKYCIFISWSATSKDALANTTPVTKYYSVIN